MVLRNGRVFVGGVCVAIVTVISTSWPNRWPGWLRFVIIILLAFASVVVIEMRHREEESRRALNQPEPPMSPPVETPIGRTPRQRSLDDNNLPNGRSHRRMPDWATLVAAELGEPLPARAGFRGRQRDLANLIARHDAARSRVSGGEGGGGMPALIFMHGMPGVGKSAVAQELARRLADQYPDGQVYVNVRNAGDGLSAAEILKVFLDKLGWRETMPELTTERAFIFRTLTAGKSMLFVLDAARDHRQLLDVLPNETRCAAIVTSRRNIGRALGIQSYRLDVPDADDALEMLGAAAGTPGPATQPALEIIDYCGRLPLALQSAGERVSQEHSTLLAVAGFLRNPSTRLARLTRLGRNLEDGLGTEYRQLDADERRALWMLSVVEAESFVPWVLCPMMSVTMDAAVDLTDRLRRAQFLEYMSDDLDTRLARYRMHPLIKLFAKARLLEEPGGQDLATEAIGLLDLAYEGVVCEVLRFYEPDFAPRNSIGVAGHPSAGRDLAAMIAVRPDRWIRLEYPNIARSLRKAFATGEWGVCWRIAKRLGSVIPDGMPVADVIELFEYGLEAAGNDGSALGAIDVRISHGGCLVAVERYAEAFALLETARDLATRLELEGSHYDASARLRQGLVHLKRGEAFLQMRRPRDADDALFQADLVFGELGKQRESALVQLLIALNSDTNIDKPDAELIRELGEENRFWISLQRFEEFRRGRIWADAEQYLNAAQLVCHGDARRTANVLYRRARLQLELRRSTQADGIAGRERLLPHRAIHRATEAMVTSRRVENRAGEIRAQCLLVRAHTAAHRLAAGHAQMDLIERALDQPAIRSSPAYEPLLARVLWARGELRRAESPDTYDDADLRTALEIFTRLEDGRSKDALDALLDDDRPKRGGHRVAVDDSRPAG